METSGKTKFLRLVFFALTVLVMVLVLKLLNWIPASIQKEDMRKYQDIEDVRAQLKIPKIYTPTYFPDHIAWPPAEVFAQRRPFTMVVMHFRHKDERSLALSVYQVNISAKFEPQYNADLLYVKRESLVSIKGKEGKLVLAVCSGNEVCNRLSWENGSFRITLISDDEPESLIKIAESMI